MKAIRDLRSPGNGVAMGARPAEGGRVAVRAMPAYERIGTAALDIDANLPAERLEEIHPETEP